MRVVFSRLQNCPGFSDDDFKEDGSAFQHVGPETAKAREPHVTVLVRGEYYSNLSGNLLNNFFHFIIFNYNHIKF